jgi:hypothetical protein
MGSLCWRYLNGKVKANGKGESGRIRSTPDIRGERVSDVLLLHIGNASTPACRNGSAASQAT